jgi:hypothetical protein
MIVVSQPNPYRNGETRRAATVGENDGAKCCSACKLLDGELSVWLMTK